VKHTTIQHSHVVCKTIMLKLTLQDTISHSHYPLKIFPTEAEAEMY